MLSFCKSCSNLNSYVTTPTKKLIMKCSSCGRPEDNITDTCVYYNKFVQSSYDIRIDPDQCYDPTLPNTDQIKCLNTTTCPSNNPGYMIFVGEKLVELQNTHPDVSVEEKFREMGSVTGSWILEGWSELNEEQIGKYEARAKAPDASDNVNLATLKKMGVITGNFLSASDKNAGEAPYMPTPKVVFFHYNKDMKLAYICCLCRTYWHN